ncbi:hypothetical protein AJ79_00823 [Helicocarpus griseus UAMH5409]|uniref:Uncharacterized protein n=1 Tax=Helicocarpus griseus UAMH5409 TaxID=1447875 RepID=A0A2B7Y1H6_9EURO|nr:hypothetical protein AJ79_00823 [Helicocarpus griseus UAMH5409]
MQLSTSVLTTAVAALLTTTNAASCRRADSGDGYRFYVGADDIENISDTCGLLWKNLDRFPTCFFVTNPTCNQGDKGWGHLHWEFSVSKACNSGMVESSWWEATKNKKGHINC